MADDLLKELLTSPLEEPPKRRRRARREDAGDGITPDGAGDAGDRGDIPRVPLLWGLGAAVLGAAIVITGYSIASEDPAPASTTSTTTTTVAAADDGAPAGLPAGYVAAGDRLGMRVERILARADGVFVTITTVVENSLDPGATTGFQGGLWTLVLEDGRRITSTIESFDALARGTVSVQFPAGGYTAEDVVSIELNGTATRTTNTLQFAFEEEATLSEDGPVTVAIDPSRFDLDAGVTLVLDSMELDPTSGRMAWTLEGDATSNAIITPFLTVTDPDGTTIEVPPHEQSSGFNNFHPSIPGPVLEPAGVAAVSMAGSSTLPVGTPLDGSLTLDVIWAIHDPIVVSLPVADADLTTIAP